MKFLNYMSTPTGRVIRVLMGIAIFFIGLSVDGAVGTGLMIFSFLPPITGVLGICPINPLVGRPLRCDDACRTTAS